MIPTLAVTPGEPAGIGPDLCLRLFHQQQDPTCRPVLVADPDLLAGRAAHLGININIRTFDPANERPPAGTLEVLPVSLENPAAAGQLDAANARYVLDTLDLAVTGCLEHRFQGLVTGPVQKSIINDAGIPFIGHTEYLANKCGVDTVVMMLATEGLRVALATTHLPLAQIPAAITRPLLRDIITVLHRDLVAKFGIAGPRILVTGLNPHAGEGGHLGREEIDTIIPALDEARSRGMDLVGPLPADTLFTDKNLAGADAVLAMYHDQGLPVLKYKGFGNAVNITLGLPIVRTSVDHGTALPLAGTGEGDTGSLATAIRTATELARYWIGGNAGA